MGADALRYFLLREVVFGQDGSFSYDALVGRYNSDLANGLGNLASRTLTMIHQYRDGVGSRLLRAIAHRAKPPRQTTSTAARSVSSVSNSRKRLEAIWGVIARRGQIHRGAGAVEAGQSAATRVQAANWTSLCTPPPKLCASSPRCCTPVLPESGAEDLVADGLHASGQRRAHRGSALGQLAGGQKLGAVSRRFPRADAKLSIEKMRELEVEEYARQMAVLGKTVPAAAAADPKITIDDFVKVDMRVGQVKAAAAVKGADKLLHLQVDIGEPKPRSIVAGIAGAYEPERLIGRKIAIVANLQPRKLKGLESQGMIIAASLEGGSPALVSFLEDAPIGARLK